jgi:hypothetical protein
MSLVGLTLFSVSLVITTSALTWLLLRHDPGTKAGAPPLVSSVDPLADLPKPATVPEWGELVERNIQLERPDEYTGFELEARLVADWKFPGADREQARALMESCGVPAAASERALSPAMVTEKPDGLVVHPDEALIVSVPGAARAKLYAELGRRNGIPQPVIPFSFSTKDFLATLESSGLPPATQTMIRNLSYVQGDRTSFSDLGFVLQRLATDEERMNVARVLSRISAVLVRLRVRPDSDIDKIVAYWSSVPGVRSKDVRPLLESVRRADGTISLTYLLPSFARERLYTFPLTTKAGGADSDCHWTTMNFFNETPDDRFSNVDFTSRYITENYYPIARPGKYGDLVFVLDKNGGANHSAVFLAGDIVFTKNGQSFGQPWLLMHLADVASLYSDGGEPRLLFYRKKDT